MSARRASLAELLAGVRAAEPGAIARSISLLEDGDALGEALLAELGDEGARCYAVGLTGPPGAGKSTLAAALVADARGAGKRVGVVSVDPTSPFSSGALLGDRVRLSEHYLDPGVFIRSMASRGHPGGLAFATAQTLRVLAAAGKDVVFVETVGVGQAELGVLAVADTVLLVLAPGLGDSVQALKAGILEAADLIVVNKRDLPGAAATAAELRRVLALGAGEPPRIVTSDARTREGSAELWALIEEGRAAAERDGSLERRRGDNRAAQVLAVASARAGRYLENAVRTDPELEALLEQARLGRLDPLAAARQVLGKVFRIDDQDDPHTR